MRENTCGKSWLQMRNNRTAVTTNVTAALVVVMILVGLVIGYAASMFMGPRPAAVTTTSTKSSTTTVLETTTITISTTFTEEKWKLDGVVEENEYVHSLEVADGRYLVHWRNDDEYLYMALEGQTDGWVSIGFEPSVSMKDADMVFGWVRDGEATVLDLYSTGPTGPHPTDEELGGTNDVLEYGGSEKDGYTVVEFKRNLDTQDKYDKTFARGQTIKIIWAFADVDELETKHNIARGSGELTLD